jgi:hypothetical protein
LVLWIVLLAEKTKTKHISRPDPKGHLSILVVGLQGLKHRLKQVRVTAKITIEDRNKSGFCISQKVNVFVGKNEN